VSKGDFYSAGYYAGLAPEPRFAKVLKIASDLGGERLLDIGCGDGSFTLLLKDALKAKETVGIEIAPEAVDALAKKGLKAYQVDIDEQPFPLGSGSFDVVYCGEIIEHLFNPDHLLEEVYRVLKPGGSCILTTPNLAGWPNRLALLLGYQPFATSVSPEHEGAGKLIMKGNEGQWGHIRVFTNRALLELLKIHQFKVKRLAGCPVTAKTSSSRIWPGLIKAVDNMMSVFPSLASRIIVVVEKPHIV
jgi:methionine biosynthesis protein MetW